MTRPVKASILSTVDHITHREDVMNKTTQDIMQLLAVNCDTALQVQDIMDCNGIDYSECTTKQFNREVRNAYAEFQTR